jgi:hypothetical protein
MSITMTTSDVLVSTRLSPRSGSGSVTERAFSSTRVSSDSTGATGLQALRA